MKFASRLAAAGLATLLLAAGKPSPDEPKKIGLVEKAGTHLAQVDVTVSGKPEILETLGPDDFALWVLRKRVDHVLVDRVCQPEASKEPEAPKEPEVPKAPKEPARQDARSITVRSQPATYLFYFDQPHLTMAGRQRALDLAREIIPKVMTGGARGMVISSANELAVIAPLTEDRAKLLDAIGRLEKDRSQWSPYATLEEKRVDEVIEVLDDPMGGVEQAIARARFFQAEEAWQMEKSLNRVGRVMGAFADADPPKAVFFFADTLRSRPGGHYLSMFNSRAQKKDAGQLIESDASLASLTLDRIVNEAAALGIRFYTIEAQGLVSLSSTSRGVGLSGAYSANNTAVPSSVRIHDAQDTLSSMALETGGRAFLNGISGAKIASRVLEDLSCVFLVSFDPGNFPVDEPLSVRVQVTKPGVTVQGRGRLVIQSDSSRLTARLLAAFSNPEAATTNVSLGAHVIPTGYADGAFSALVQLSVPASSYPNATWDFGASLVSRGKVREDSSAHVAVTASGLPLVFEQEMRFAPGPFEIVAVAHETTTDQIASRQVEGVWPDLRDVPAAVGPIALLQPVGGAFYRNGATHGRGSLARGEAEPIGSDRPTAFVTLVCRGRDRAGPLRVERRLLGESTVSFDPQDLDFSSDLCAQTRDLVPATSLGPGEFRYEIRVLKGDQEVARGERKFVVAAPAGPPPGGG